MAALAPSLTNPSPLLLDKPINLLHCDTPFKLSFWITHLPHYQSYISHIHKQRSNSQHGYPPVTMTKTLYEVDESDLVITEQIGKMFYENWISGYLIYKNDIFAKKDFMQLMDCYKNIVDMNDTMVQYVWEMIHKSQVFYNDNMKQRCLNNDNKLDKNWINDTYDEHCSCYINYIEQHCKVITMKKSEWINDDATSPQPTYTNSNHNQLLPQSFTRQYTHPLFLSNTSEEHFEMIAAVE